MKKAPLFLLLFLICNLIYLFPKVDYSPVPVEWSPGIDWGRYYIVNEGKIYQNEDNFLTWQSSLKNYGSEDILPKIYYAIINLVTGTTSFPNDLSLHYKLPWIGALLLPLIVLSLYYYLAKREHLTTLNSNDGILLYAFSSFPLMSTLSTVSGNTNGSALGRALFLLLLVSIIIIFDENKRNPQRVLVFLILCIATSCYYHTWSYYIIICLLVISFFTVSKNKEKFISSLLFSGIIIFISSSIYFNHKLLYEPVRVIHNFPSLFIDLNSVSYASKINSKYLGYDSFSSYHSYFQLIGSMLILLLCFIYVCKYISDKKSNCSPIYNNILFYIIISEFIIGSLLFLWDGFLGLFSRFFESLVYVSMLISAYLLIKCEPRLKFYIRTILVLSILISISCYLVSPEELHWELTDEEFTGIEFSGKNIQNTSYIFSDFRLAPPLLYYGKLGIMTIDGTNDLPQTTEEILENCYYNVTKPETVFDKIIPSNDYYFLLSSHQTEVYLLDTSLKRFNQVPHETLNQWESQKQFNEIYDSKYFYLYKRRI